MSDQPRDLLDALRFRIADPGAYLPRRFADGEPAETIAFWAARAIAAALEDGTLGYVPAEQRDRLAERLQGVTVNFDRIAAELADAERDNARLERRCDRLTTQRDERLTLAESSNLAKMVDDLRDRLKATSDAYNAHANLISDVVVTLEDWLHDTTADGTPIEHLLNRIRHGLREGPAPVPGSSQRAQEPDEAAIRVDERADIARQLELLAADEALIADWVTTCDPIPLTVPDWLRALAGKIRAGDPDPGPALDLSSPKLAQGGRRNGCGPACSEGHTYEAGCAIKPPARAFLGERPCGKPGCPCGGTAERPIDLDDRAPRPGDHRG